MAYKYYKPNQSGGVTMDPKDPDDSILVVFDFAGLTNGTGLSDFLEAGESIASYVLTPQTGITVAGDSSTANTVSCIVSGGSNGSTYTLACRITTDASPARVIERTMNIPVRTM